MYNVYNILCHIDDRFFSSPFNIRAMRTFNMTNLHLVESTKALASAIWVNIRIIFKLYKKRY